MWYLDRRDKQSMSCSNIESQVKRSPDTPPTLDVQKRPHLSDPLFPYHSVPAWANWMISTIPHQAMGLRSGLIKEGEGGGYPRG